MDGSSGGSGDLRDVFDAMVDGVIHFDADGRIVDCNRAACRLLGWDPTSMEIHELGLAGRLMRRDGSPLEPHEYPAMRALRGEVVRDVPLAFRTPVGRIASVLTSASPLVDDSGLTGAIVSFHDVTLQDKALDELRDSAFRSAALARIGAIVGSTLETDEIMRAAIREISDAVGAETAAIVMREDGAWTTHYSHRFPVDIIGVVLTDEQCPHALMALNTAAPVAIDDAYEDPTLDQETMRAYGIRSVLTMPLIQQGDVVGAMFLNHHSAPVAFTQGQIEFVAHAAATISLALRNAELYDDQRRVADTLQQAMLTVPGQLPGVAFSCLYRSATGNARVGGDFYGVFPLPGDRIGVAIGDVSGKGLAAAATASMVKDTVRAFATAGDPPSEVLRKTNEVIHHMLDSASFVTILFGVLDPAACTFTYCSGGHPPAMLVRGGSAELLSEGGTIVGPFRGSEYREESCTMGPEDTLVMYTDGVTEARRDSELYGEDRLVASIVSLPAAMGLERLIEHLFFEVLDHTGGPLADDVAILAVRLAPLS